MSTGKSMRPVFQSVEIEPIDERLEAKAAEKGIPTLVTPKSEGPAEAVVAVTASVSRKPVAGTASTPRFADEKRKDRIAGLCLDRVEKAGG